MKQCFQQGAFSHLLCTPPKDAFDYRALQYLFSIKHDNLKL
jgi:hypothetical protein